MHPVKELARQLRFVGLEVTHQMPGNRQIGERRVFRMRLLNAILAEVAQPGVVSLADTVRGHGLRHRHQLDFLGTATGAKASGGNAFLNLRDVLFKVRHGSSVAGAQLSAVHYKVN